MRASEDDVVVADGVPEEVFRKHIGILHLKKYLCAAEIPPVPVLKQFRLLAEHTAEVGGCLEERDIALGQFPVNGHAYSRLDMRVVVWKGTRQQS